VDTRTNANSPDICVLLRNFMKHCSQVSFTGGVVVVVAVPLQYGFDLILV
jgi:hypothetical protein